MKYRTWSGKSFCFTEIGDGPTPNELCVGKDDVGNEIYVGDIVEQFNMRGRLLRTGVIVYDEKEMKFKIRSDRCPDWNEKTDDFSFHPLKQRLIVIGNIHKGIG